MSHTTRWTGKVQPARDWTPAPKVPGPLSPEARAARQPRETTITMHHDYDPTDGNVHFYLANWVADAEHVHHAGPNGEGMVRLYIPFEAIKHLVLNYYRNKFIDDLESAEGQELEDVLHPILDDQVVRTFGKQPEQSVKNS